MDTGDGDGWCWWLETMDVLMLAEVFHDADDAMDM